MISWIHQHHSKNHGLAASSSSACLLRYSNGRLEKPSSAGETTVTLVRSCVIVAILLAARATVLLPISMRSCKYSSNDAASRTLSFIGCIQLMSNLTVDLVACRFIVPYRKSLTTQRRRAWIVDMMIVVSKRTWTCCTCNSLPDVLKGPEPCTIQCLARRTVLILVCSDLY